MRHQNATCAQTNSIVLGFDARLFVHVASFFASMHDERGVYAAAWLSRRRESPYMRKQRQGNALGFLKCLQVIHGKPFASLFSHP